MMHVATSRHVLEQGIEEMGLTVPKGAVDILLAYLAQIERWNPSLGLVGACDDLVARHLLDSLSGVPLFASLPAGARILDLGSGAGLPGIPLAVALPGHRFILVERSTRRGAFLDRCVADLALGNVRVVARDLRELREAVDAVTLRAVSPLTPEFLQETGILDRAPLLVAYKGKYTRAREEGEAVSALYGSLEILPVRVPYLEGERHLVVLRR
jgi:16S rRNA (guanine527-N7)-methyltransferase